MRATQPSIFLDVTDDLNHHVHLQADVAAAGADCEQVMDTTNWPRWVWYLIIAVSFAAMLLFSCAQPIVTDVWPPDTVIPTPIGPTPVPTLLWMTLEIQGCTCDCECRKVD